MGTRPVTVRDGRAQVASQAMVARTEAALPGYLAYMVRAARSGYRVRQANAYGTFWDITRAKQHQLRDLRRIARGF
jgi:hypothetical protein